MENKLKSMMEFQKFEQNDRLEKLVRETESRWSKRILDDDELDMVFAAKGLDAMPGVLSGERKDK